MVKKDGGNSESKTKKNDEEKEGKNLMGKPSFKKLENGRFRCVQTGHELAANEKDSYANTKHCRLGLIDSALFRQKPPLNMFVQSPDDRSKLTCKLTGMTVNKTEEHIWKHINGKKFLSMLEKKENEEQTEDGVTGEDSEPKEDKSSKRKIDDLKKKEKAEVVEVKEEVEEEDEEFEIVDENYGKVKEEEDFWMPPVGDRWDLDKGGDRWGSDSDDEDDDDAATDDKTAADDVVEVENGEEGEADKEKPSKRSKIKVRKSESSEVASSDKKKKNKKKKKKRKATPV